MPADGAESGPAGEFRLSDFFDLEIYCSNIVTG